jgi:hypothetical protein
MKDRCGRNPPRGRYISGQTGREPHAELRPESEVAMVKVKKADPSLMDKRNRAKSELSPAARERERQLRQFKRMIGQITSPDQVFEVQLDATEKPITIRQRILRAAAEANVEIAVRKHGSGFIVGLLTPERRTNRGRRAATTPQG